MLQTTGTIEQLCTAHSNLDKYQKNSLQDQNLKCKNNITFTSPATRSQEPEGSKHNAVILLLLSINHGICLITGSSSVSPDK
jgi:hypothetical protein